MYDDGVISEAEYNKALDEELKFVGEEEEDELESVMYYQDAVIEELKSLKEIPESFLRREDLKSILVLIWTLKKVRRDC